MDVVFMLKSRQSPAIPILKEFLPILRTTAQRLGAALPA
jgi:hypothetical protein